ncbi:hypothetical protein C0J52_07375 [Blattella germanica]|nr:hypothetical protein C0J52_07375 [Blattella germanica]
MKKCQVKLANHMAENETNIIFKAINKLFNSGMAGQIIDVNPQKVITKSRIPYFNKVNDDYFLCASEYFHKNLQDAVGDNSNVDCLQMLLAMKFKFPFFDEAAIQSIWTPTNSVDAERFFSKYNLIVTDRRTRLKESNIVVCCMLNFN